MHLCLPFLRFLLKPAIQKVFVNGCYLGYINYDEARTSQVGPFDPVAIKAMHKRSRFLVNGSNL